MSRFNLFDCSQVELPAGAPPVGGLLGVVEQLICMSQLEFCFPTTFYRTVPFPSPR